MFRKMKLACFFALAAVMLLSLPLGSARAGVVIGVGIPWPGYYRPYYHPYRVYVAPPPVVVAPAPVYVAPAPAPVYVVPAPQPVYVQPAPTVIQTQAVAPAPPAPVTPPPSR
jgi:hypothetical protein